MKITVVGDAVVVSTTKTMEELEKLEKYRPKALCLTEKDDDGVSNELFVVRTTTGKGSMNKWGATFNGSSRDDAKLATLTMAIPAGTENALEYVTELLGVGVLHLKKLEEQWDAALTELNGELTAIREAITVA